MKTLRKVPVLGWLIGALAALAAVAWWLWRRLSIAQARIRVDAKLRKAKAMNGRAAAAIVAGHTERGRELAIESEKRTVFYAKKRADIRSKAANLGGLSQAVNASFDPGD